jgi:hypothetical protein
MALTEDEKKEVLAEALARKDLEALLEEGAAARRAVLEGQRRRWQEQLGEDLAWLEGAAELETGSWDLLAVRVLWPG